MRYSAYATVPSVSAIRHSPRIWFPLDLPPRTHSVSTALAQDTFCLSETLRNRKGAPDTFCPLDPQRSGLQESVGAGAPPHTDPTHTNLALRHMSRDQIRDSIATRPLDQHNSTRSLRQCDLGLRRQITSNTTPCQSLHCGGMRHPSRRMHEFFTKTRTLTTEAQRHTNPCNSTRRVRRTAHHSTITRNGLAVATPMATPPPSAA